MHSFSDHTLKEKLSRLNPVVIDTETTGTNPCIHDLLSVALTPLDRGKPNLLLFVRSKRDAWSKNARDYFRGYRQKWDASAVSPEDALEEIERYLADNFDGPVTLIGHNVGFDLAFLRRLAAEASKEEVSLVSHRTIDTYTLLVSLYLKGRIPETALSSDGAFEHFGIEVAEETRHTALGDALATRELFSRLLDQLLQAGLEAQF